MPAEQGYRVATTQMSGPAKELDGCGDDAEKVRRAVAPVACYTQDTLGGSDSAAAFNEFASAWVAETATLRDALHELADKVHLAKGAYGGSDNLVATRAAAVDTGNGSLSTRPTPAGDRHLTTMPTYAERPSALSGY
jgi:uncharacterized protein YukE